MSVVFSIDAGELHFTLWSDEEGNTFRADNGFPVRTLFMHGPDKQVETIYQCLPGRWFSFDGVEFALSDDASSVDPIDRCGIGRFSLPTSVPINCAPHDFAYSSPTYQVFHTRKEADEMLESLTEQAPGLWNLLAKPFYWISRQFGAIRWEDPKTND